MKLLLATAAVAVVVGAGAYAYREWWSDHYVAGTARIESYSITNATELVVNTASGWQDVVEQPVVTEDPRTVTITVPTRVWVPGRNGFKQLSATLGSATVTLRSPLGDRLVVDGVTHSPVRRLPDPGG